jgi:hypothetical protein
VLKKPQRIGIPQFVQCVEQFNAYVAQLPCWYYSPRYNASMTPANVPFSKADLASHVLQMCPHQWRDQYNLQEKGMTPMDMRSLQASLKAIERICTHKKAHVPSSKKASYKNKAVAKRPSNGAMKQAHKKVHLEKSCKLCKKYGGAHTMLGGPVGLPPPFLFYSGRKTQNLKAKKERKNRGPTELTTIAISVIPNFNAPSRLLAWATIPIAVLSNRQLWRRDRIEHIVLHAVLSPKLAILRLRQ